MKHNHNTYVCICIFIKQRNQRCAVYLLSMYWQSQWKPTAAVAYNITTQLVLREYKPTPYPVRFTMEHMNTSSGRLCNSFNGILF